MYARSPSSLSSEFVILCIYLNIFFRIAKEEGEEGPDKYRIEFMYDADKPGTIQLHFNALEINEGTDVR